MVPVLGETRTTLGYPVVTEETIVEAGSLPSHWFAQCRIMGSNLGPPVVKR